MDNLIVVPVITIDGPAASGKGTLAKALSELLKWNYLDSGFIYRAVSFLLLQEYPEFFSMNPDRKMISFESFLKDFKGKIIEDPLETLKKQPDFYVQLKTERTGEIASRLSVLTYFRKGLTSLFQIYRKAPGLVADGRDMGSVVFPDAILKIYLDADLKERALRRSLELQQRDIHVNFEELLKKVCERDFRDQSRTEAPLIASENSLKLDSTHSSTQELLNQVLMELKKNSFSHFLWS